MAEGLCASGAVELAVAILVLAAAVVAGWVVREMASRRSRRLPPGPLGLPIVGNLLQLLGGKLQHRQLAQLSKQYGPLVYMKLGGAPTILVSDSHMAKTVLSGTNDRIFASRPPSEVGRRLSFGSGIRGIALSPNDEHWRQARKICSVELFAGRRVSEMEPLRRAEIVALVEEVRAHIERSPTGEALNLTQATALLVEGMTYRLLLDKSLAEMEDGKLGIDLPATAHRYIQLLQAPLIGDFIPWLGFLDRSTKVALDEIHINFNKILDNIIREREQRHRPPGSTAVILDVLLEGGDLQRAKRIMADLITAAIDTSATVLDWIMAELLANPGSSRKLQEELEQVGRGEDRMIEEAELAGLRYLKAVVKETMRLHAPSPLMLPHMATEACSVGGYSIPKGCRLLVNVWAIGRDPKSWDDPERFMPERFLSENGSCIDLRGQHFELLPFGSGRRRCPGVPIVLPIVESAIANLVYLFDWKVLPGHVVDFTEHGCAVIGRANPLFAVPSLRHRT